MRTITRFALKTVSIFPLIASMMLLSTCLTGCVGLQTVYLKKETFDNRCIISLHGLQYWKLPEELPQGNLITKQNLVNYWGKPVKIIKNGDQEDWIYTQTRWIGVGVIACFRLPLCLPLGNGKAVLTFKNDDFIGGSDTPLCASLHMFSIAPPVPEAKWGEFFYSGPQPGCDYPSYGGGTYCQGGPVY